MAFWALTAGMAAVTNAQASGWAEGQVNTFTGLNLQDLTGGVFNGATLFEGNNLACFFLQASLAGMPTQLDGLVSNVGEVLAWVSSQIGPLSDALGCPQLGEFDNELFNQFPGAADFVN